MTRKDFELIAQWLHDARPFSEPGDIEHPFEENQWERTLSTIANGLKQTNVRLNKEKFVEACRKGFG
jgi:hypothetical protein